MAAEGAGAALLPVPVRACSACLGAGEESERNDDCDGSGDRDNNWGGGGSHGDGGSSDCVIIEGDGRWVGGSGRDEWCESSDEHCDKNGALTDNLSFESSGTTVQHSTQVHATPQSTRSHGSSTDCMHPAGASQQPKHMPTAASDSTPPTAQRTEACMQVLQMHARHGNHSPSSQRSESPPDLRLISSSRGNLRPYALNKKKPNLVNPHPPRLVKPQSQTQRIVRAYDKPVIRCDPSLSPPSTQPNARPTPRAQRAPLLATTRLPTTELHEACCGGVGFQHALVGMSAPALMPTRLPTTAATSASRGTGEALFTWENNVGGEQCADDDCGGGDGGGCGGYGGCGGCGGCGGGGRNGGSGSGDGGSDCCGGGDDGTHCGTTAGAVCVNIGGELEPALKAPAPATQSSARRLVQRWWLPACLAPSSLQEARVHNRGGKRALAKQDAQDRELAACKEEQTACSCVREGERSWSASGSNAPTPASAHARTQPLRGASNRLCFGDSHQADGAALSSHSDTLAPAQAPPVPSRLDGAVAAAPPRTPTPRHRVRRIPSVRFTVSQAKIPPNVPKYLSLRLTALHPPLWVHPPSLVDSSSHSPAPFLSKMSWPSTCPKKSLLTPICDCPLRLSSLRPPRLLRRPPGRTRQNYIPLVALIPPLIAVHVITVFRTLSLCKIVNRESTRPDLVVPTCHLSMFCTPPHSLSSTRSQALLTRRELDLSSRDAACSAGQAPR
eukprot:3345090-Pleurochrysis_carterae.AAC.1